MITVKSLRGGVTVKGTDTSGTPISHTFPGPKKVKKFREVSRQDLLQGKKLGWFTFDGKPEPLTTKKAKQANIEQIAAAEELTEQTRGVHSELRTKLATEKRKVGIMGSGKEKEAAESELKTLSDETHDAGKAYEAAYKAMTDLD